MDSSDFNTRLPPRKRLLAGLKKGASECDFQLPFPSISSNMYAHLRDLFSSAASSPEEIVEASKAAALAAAEAAARARANAVEKAALAVKARSAARDALELLDTVAMNEARGKGRLARRKKHVAVKLLYKTKRPLKIRETDEEVARRLHHAMNTSPRLSYKPRKKLQVSGSEAASDGSLICNSNSAVLVDENVQLVNGVSVDKIEEKAIVSPKAALLERVLAGGKKVKVKQKKLSLSHCNIRDQVKPGMPNGELKLDAVERKMTSNDKGPSHEGMVSMKINSVWKCKKFKISKPSSGSKTAHSLNSNPSANKPSAMVEVD